MVSAIWISVFTGIGQMVGMSPAAACILFTFMFSIVLAISFYIVAQQNSRLEDKGEIIATLTFFASIGVFTLAGAMDWYLTIIIFGMYILINKQVKEHGQ